MKIHSQCECRNLNGFVKTVPTELLNEEWAQNNHSQSLKRLDERGGLSVMEVLAIVQRRPYMTMEPAKALTILLHILWDLILLKEYEKNK